MNKLALLLTVGIVTGLASVKVMDSQPEASVNAWADEQRTDDRVTAYKCFKYTFDATLEDLCRGSIRLKEAHRRVLATARQYHPDYFVFLAYAETGETDEERAAHNLAGHVMDMAELSPQMKGCGTDMPAQLQELLDELHGKNSAVE